MTDLIPVQIPTIKTCWFCTRPGVLGYAWLTSKSGKTKIPACSPGTGCRDGKVYHGPAGGPPHWPSQAHGCPDCNRRLKGENAGKHT